MSAKRCLNFLFLPWKCFTYFINPVRHQRVRRNGAELARLEVLDRLDQLGLGVHHERAVLKHRLVNWLAAQDQNLERRPPRLLRLRGRHGDPVARPEHGQLPLVNRLPHWADRPAARQYVDQRVEVAVPRQVQTGAGLNSRMRQGDWRVRRSRPLMSVDLACDDADQRAAVVRRQQPDLVALDRLILRCRELVLARQVHPQLDAVEHAATLHQLSGRGLDVQYPRACRHPLGGAVGDEAASPVRILMRETAVDHVGDGFEPAVRMPVGAPRLARLVFDFAHLVHVDERVEVGGADSGERAHDGKPLALVALRAGGDGPDGPFGVGRRRCGDTGKRQGVGGNSWHANS